MDKNIKRKAIQIQNSILKILAKYWDPIGIGGDPNADKEYDSYVGEIYRILVSNPSETTIINCLSKIEIDNIGEETFLHTKRFVAKKLLQLNVSLNKDAT